jgi:hypothetical protein
MVFCNLNKGREIEAAVHALRVGHTQRTMLAQIQCCRFHRERGIRLSVVNKTLTTVSFNRARRS